jgi:hypothetical protein
MTASPSSRLAHSRWLIFLTLCASVVALSNVLAPHASASSHHPATMIKSVVVSGVAAPPGAPNNPAALIVANKGFSVTLTFSDGYGNELPLSWTKSTKVTLSVAPAEGEPATDAHLVGPKTTIVVPAGASTATGSGFKISPAANRVRIGASVDAGYSYVTVPEGFSEQFDVVLRAVTGTADETFLSTTGASTECKVTGTSPYCVDLYLPFGSETGSVLSVGECDSFLGCSSPDQLVVQALADLGPAYSPTSPALAVYKCDTTVCPKSSYLATSSSTSHHVEDLTKYHLFVSLAATGPLAQAAACSSAGVVDEGSDFCVDYTQSTRDKSGDVQLHLLLARDARMSCC